jgi:hypothetical protein
LTFKYLFTRPGHITKEYTAGKRVKFVQPIKLYIFSSFLFFLLYFALTPKEDKVKIDQETKAQLDANREKARESFASLPDSLKAGDLSTENWFRRLYTFESREKYDSFQSTLPDEYRDGILERKMARYYFSAANGVTNSDEESSHAAEAQEELFHHNYPKMMFVLLPLFALYLRWMYDKKKWFYADHAIFSIHLHVFFFIFYLFCAALDRLFHTEAVTSIGLLVIFAYLIIALRNTYGQSWGKSVLKGVLLTFTYLVTLLIVFIGFMATMTLLNT